MDQRCLSLICCGRCIERKMREEQKMKCENCSVEIHPAEEHYVLQDGGCLCVDCFDALDDLEDEDEDEDEDTIQ